VKFTSHAMVPADILRKQVIENKELFRGIA
jgi:hypothetical protein